MDGAEHFGSSAFPLETFSEAYVHLRGTRDLTGIMSSQVCWSDLRVFESCSHDDIDADADADTAWSSDTALASDTSEADSGTSEADSGVDSGSSGDAGESDADTDVDADADGVLLSGL